MIPKDLLLNKPYDTNETLFRDRFRKLDRAKDNKDFDAAQPEFLDRFIEDPVLAEALESFKTSASEIEELKQHALRQIREKNSHAESICRRNGIKLPAYCSNMPSLEDIEDPIKRKKLEQMLNISVFQAYEMRLLKSSIPLVMSLNFALDNTLDIMKNKGLSLEEKADSNNGEPNFFEQWLKKWREVNGFVIYNLLLLLRDNRYRSLLKQHMLPSNILEKPCGLEALIRCSLPVASEQDRLSERKLIAYRVYFYAQRLHDQSKNNEPKECLLVENPTNCAAAKPQPSTINSMRNIASGLSFDESEGIIKNKELSLAEVKDTKKTKLKQFTSLFFPNGKLSQNKFHWIIIWNDLNPNHKLPSLKQFPSSQHHNARNSNEYAHICYLKKKLTSAMTPHFKDFIVLNDECFYVNPDLFLN